MYSGLEQSYLGNMILRDGNMGILRENKKLSRAHHLLFMTPMKTCMANFYY